MLNELFFILLCVLYAAGKMRIFNNKDVYVISNGLTLETDNKNGSEGTTFEAALRVVGKLLTF